MTLRGPPAQVQHEPGRSRTTTAAPALSYTFSSSNPPVIYATAGLFVDFICAFISFLFKFFILVFSGGEGDISTSLFSARGDGKLHFFGWDLVSDTDNIPTPSFKALCDEVTDQQAS